MLRHRFLSRGAILALALLLTSGSAGFAQVGPVIYVDNADPGFAVNGTWDSLSGQGYNGSIRMISAGTADSTATWTTPVTPGQYRVSVTYSTGGTRVTSAPYSVSAGGTVYPAVNLNQRSTTGNLTETIQGVTTVWRDLGAPYNITSATNLVVTLNASTATPAGGVVVADAVRVERLGDVPTGPEIEVLNGNTNIADGTGTVAFGSTMEGTFVDRTLTLRNIGTTNLILTPPISVPSGYSVNASFSTTTVAPRGQATFRIRLDATSGGTFNGQVSFATNDADENPFNFNVTGTVNVLPTVQIIDNGDPGYARSGSSWFTLPLSGYQADFDLGLAFGTTSQATYTFSVLPGRYRVSATWPFHSPSQLLRNTNYTVLNGTTLQVGNGVIDQSRTPLPTAPAITDGGVPWQDLGGPYQITGNVLTVRLSVTGGYALADAIRIERLDVTPTAPEIQVLQEGTDIADNTGSVAFGSTAVGAPVTRTFTVRNTGTANLTLESLTVPPGFDVPAGQGLTSPVLPGGQITFQVRLTAAAAGTFTGGQVSFSTNDLDENPFNFNVSGTVVAAGPEIQVFDGSTELTDGSSTVNFGTTPVGTSLSRQFTIRNVGDTNLNLTSDVTVPAGFTVTTTYGTAPVSVAPGGQATFTVRLDAADPGTFSGQLSFANNDANEDPFNFTISGTVTAPEIQVLDGSTDIPDNTGSVNFGTTTVGTPLNKTFTVRNVGTANLSLNSPVTVPPGFTVTTTYGTAPVTVTPGSQVTFVVQLTAAAAGPFTGQLSFNNSDGDESPFNFTISGTVTAAPAPEIQVLDGSTDIPDNTGSVNFGTTTVGTPVNKTFTVRNTGTANLSLTSAVTVPAGFTVTTTYGTAPVTVTPGSQVTFVVQLTAAATGPFSGQLSFNNSDADESPFNFTISGTVNPPSVPEIQVLQGTTDIPDNTGSVNFGTTPVGTSVSRTFTVRNTGTANLSLTSAVTVPAGFTVTTTYGTAPVTVTSGSQATFTVRLDATASGPFSGSLSFTNNDSDESPFNFTISGEVTAPEIQVLEGSTDIPLGNAVDFGSTTVGAAISRTFIVRNIGTGNLSLTSAVTVPAGFTVTTTYGTAPVTVTPGSQVTFTVRLDATAQGTFSGSLSFSNTDADENPFSFPISGVVDAVPVPEIEVRDGPDAASPLVADGGTLSFGTTPFGSSISKTLTIRNLGNANLLITSPVTGTPNGFTITSPLTPTPSVGSPLVLGFNSTTTFTVRLDATAAGTYSGTLTFSNNDSDENPYNFTISGTVGAAPASEIDVRFGSTPIADGSTTPFNFGSMAVGGTPLDRTFTISNLGTANLTLGTVSLPNGFTVLTPFGTTTVAPSATTTIVVRFNPTTFGTFTGELSFDNNDANENPYNFAISGTATAAEIEVRNGALATDPILPDNSTAAIDYGSTPLGSPVSRTFRVTNLGNANLTLGTITLPAGFAVTQGFTVNPVPPGASATFAVSLDATASGSFGGQVSFVTNDPDENPFNFPIMGTVTTISTGNIVDDGDPTFSAPGWMLTNGVGYNGDVRTLAAGTGTNTASWTFTGLTPGTYKVAVTFPTPAGVTGSPNAPYEVFDGAVGVNLRGTYFINQQFPPNDFQDANVGWEELGFFTVSGTQLSVRLSDNTVAGTTVLADAVRIERVTVIMTQADAVRFLNQAGWGPKGPPSTEIPDLVAQGAQAWLTNQFAVAAATPTYYPTLPLDPPVVAGTPPNNFIVSSLDSRQIGFRAKNLDSNQDRDTVNGVDTGGGAKTGVDTATPPANVLDPVVVRNSYTNYLLQRQFYFSAMYGPDQLRTKVAYALHKIVVTNTNEINPPYRYAPYLQILESNALGDGTSYNLPVAVTGGPFPRGNYRTLLLEMTLNPAMGDFLDMVNSTKANPNENYAREIMQLFSLGLYQLNEDGSLVQNAQGEPIEKYQQSDVLELARVFTGWAFRPRVTTAPRFDPTGSVNYIDPMRLASSSTSTASAEDPVNHDFGAKSVPAIGFSIAARTGSATTGATGVTNAYQELVNAINAIFNDPNTPTFVSKQLIQMLVTSNPSPAYVRRVVQVFKNNGQGVRGDMKSVISAILLDPEARGDSKDAGINPTLYASYGKQREPLQYQVNTLRAFNARAFNAPVGDTTSVSDSVFYNVNEFLNQTQDPWRPPSVFSYFPPDNPLPPPGVAGMVGPEFGLLNSSTVYARANWINFLVRPDLNNSTAAGVSVSTTISIQRPLGTSLNLDALVALVPNGSDGTALVDELNRILLNGAMSTAMRTSVLQAVNSVTTNSSLAAADKPLKKARWAVHLVLTSSQYQVQQ